MQFDTDDDDIDEWDWDEDVGGWGDESDGDGGSSTHTNDDLSSLEDALDVAPAQDLPDPGDENEEHEDIEGP